MAEGSNSCQQMKKNKLDATELKSYSWSLISKDLQGNAISNLQDYWFFRCSCLTLIYQLRYLSALFTKAGEKQAIRYAFYRLGI